jgi:hypothetical protein
MDHTTRQHTIAALAAASAAAIRTSPARALRACSGEIESELAHVLAEPICTDRELPLERTPNRITGGSTARDAWDTYDGQEVLR